jgi:hypothetical protein
MDYNFALIWQALQFNSWPDDRLSILQSEWESADFFANLSEPMGLERVEDFNYCQKLLQNPQSGAYHISEIVKTLFDDPSEAFREAGENFQETHYRGNKVLNDERNLLLFLRDRELELRHALLSPSWEQMRAQPGITNAPPFTSPDEGTTTMVSSAPRLAFRLIAFNGLAEAERRILITAVALERYHGKHGSYPQTLADLTPEFFSAAPATVEAAVPAAGQGGILPPVAGQSGGSKPPSLAGSEAGRHPTVAAVQSWMVDFMDGQSLRYRPTKDGHFLLYSVGLDCVDDGGKPPAPDAPEFFSNKNGKFVIVTNVDIVWPVPASP